MHLSTTKPAAFRMLEPFGEVGGDVPEYFSLEHILLKLKIKSCEKLVLKNLTAGVQLPIAYYRYRCHYIC